jgi:hypothetical protein
MPATWKRDRLAPIQGPLLPPTPPVWKREQRPVRQPKRGPMAKLINVACAIAITASIAVAATPAVHAQEQDGCDLNAGPSNATLGALKYVREVFDDAVIKYEDYQADPKKIGALEHVEMDNDFLCDVPRQYQETLRFMTLNVLIFVMDIMQM